MEIDEPVGWWLGVLAHQPSSDSSHKEDDLILLLQPIYTSKEYDSHNKCITKGILLRWRLYLLKSPEGVERFLIGNPQVTNKKSWSKVLHVLMSMSEW